MAEQSKGTPFTRRARRRTTRRSVVFADVVSRLLIKSGGIGTIIAVLGVCLFLVWVVLPMFSPADFDEPLAAPRDRPGQSVVHLAVDEYQQLAWTAYADGRIQVFRLDNGQVRQNIDLFDQARPTAAWFERMGGSQAVFGFGDGSIRTARIRFETRFLRHRDIPDDVRLKLQEQPVGTAIDFGNGIVQLTPGGDYRSQTLHVEVDDATSVSHKPIQLIAQAMRSNGPLICVLAGDAQGIELKAVAGQEIEDFMSGGSVIEFDDAIDLPLQMLSPAAPRYLAVLGSGDNVYIAWADGWALRINCSDLNDPFLAEKGRLTEPGRALTALGFVIGRNTLIWGDSHGQLRGGYLIRLDEMSSPGLIDVERDARTRHAMGVMKEMSRSGPAITSIAPSGRSRLIACGYENGQVRLYNVTHEGQLAAVDVAPGDPIVALAISPKQDGLVALTDQQAYFGTFDPQHPEASLAAMFTAVAYEGYAESQHMWQSSAATQETETKLGLIPLIVGTMKATFYSMLFGVPLAMLAAIYSSQFLNPRVKAWMKPTIELMASLPSVVLGFLAALVFAPFIENVVPATLAVFMAIPFMFLVGAYMWQLLPRRSQLRIEHIGAESVAGRLGDARRRTLLARPGHIVRWLLFHVGGIKMICIVVLLGAGLLLGLAAGPALEKFLFAGDIKGWLAYGAQNDEARFASAVGGWFMLLLPVCAIVGAILISRLLSPVMRKLSRRFDRGRLALLDLTKFGVAIVGTIGLCLLVSWLLHLIGADPRKPALVGPFDLSLLGTFVQRNALVVGFVMGFAIIPIIYTIADDALSSVPEHLRSASLGTGATPWQTAMRIIIPTAMSGLFSATMIGLGRAVGETMIVLMATGNTPIMNFNIFNGFRTLAANIAVELPEAVRNSTHYRTLFMAALVLFAMTFVINTLAEVVRLRFRRRAAQL